VLARAIGALGVSALAMALFTWSFVPTTGQPAARLAVLAVIAIGSITLLTVPARWLPRPAVVAAAIGAIAAQSAYVLLTGGRESPYGVGFVGVVILIAYLEVLPVAALAAAASMTAHLLSISLGHGLTGLAIAQQLVISGLAIMVTVLLSDLASRERRRTQRLGRRLARARHDARRRRRESLTDPLTGLGNRRAFELDLAAALIDRRDAGQLVLILGDIDRLKQVNDRLGHAMGDQMLIGLSAALQRAVRADDAVYRLGGDEFAVLARSDRTKGLAEHLGEVIDDDLPCCGPSAMTLGIASRDPEDSPETLFARADAALYAAKQRRRRYPLAPAQSQAPDPLFSG
jgi:diguanylate cyclase (GGDEF)-like protein